MSQAGFSRRVDELLSAGKPLSAAIEQAATEAKDHRDPFLVMREAALAPK